MTRVVVRHEGREYRLIESCYEGKRRVHTLEGEGGKRVKVAGEVEIVKIIRTPKDFS